MTVTSDSPRTETCILSEGTVGSTSKSEGESEMNPEREIAERRMDGAQEMSEGNAGVEFDHLRSQHLFCFLLSVFFRPVYFLFLFPLPFGNQDA